jgi:hypothetical protein
MQAPDTQAAVDVQAVAQLAEASGSSSVSRSQSSCGAVAALRRTGEDHRIPVVAVERAATGAVEEKPSPSTSVAGGEARRGKRDHDGQEGNEDEERLA